MQHTDSPGLNTYIVRKTINTPTHGLLVAAELSRLRKTHYLLLCFSPTEIPNEEALNDANKEVSSETPMYSRLRRKRSIKIPLIYLA